MVRPKFKDEHVFGQSLALLVLSPDPPVRSDHEPAPPLARTRLVVVNLGDCCAREGSHTD